MGFKRKTKFIGLINRDKGEKCKNKADQLFFVELGFFNNFKLAT